jgi:hypothetical protein
MQYVTQAGAWCNGEVAYLAWETAQPLPDCLGFMVTRVHERAPTRGSGACCRPGWRSVIKAIRNGWNKTPQSGRSKASSGAT